MDIRQIRAAAGLTLQEMADALGMSGRQGVSEIERRNDWLVSTLASYIRAAGGSAELVVWVGDSRLVINLD
jgi:transcriptional regulator with XRE-family HTH domain